MATIASTLLAFCILLLVNYGWSSKIPTEVRVIEERSLGNRIKVSVLLPNGTISYIPLVPANNIWSKNSSFVSLNSVGGNVEFVDETSQDKSPIYIDPRGTAVLHVENGTVNGLLDHDQMITSDKDGKHYLIRRNIATTIKTDYIDRPTSKSHPKGDKRNFNGRQGVTTDFPTLPDVSSKILKIIDKRQASTNDVNTGEQFVVEVMVIYDDAFVHKINQNYLFFKYSSEILRIRLYLTIYWNAVNQLFKDIPEVTIKLAGALRNREKLFNPVFEYKNGMKILVGSKSLEKLSNFVSNYNRYFSEKYDMVYFITGEDVEENFEESGMAGIAFRAGTCSISSERSYAVALGEDDGFFKYPVATHEVAHNLGSPHDGEEDHDTDDCKTSDGYIMTYTRVNQNQFRFSDCSKRAIREYINSDDAKCLTENHNTRKLINTQKLPGELTTLNELCERLSGQVNSKFVYPENENEMCFNVTCKTTMKRIVEMEGEMVVSTAVSHLLTNNIVPEGAECLKGKKCLNGKCQKP